MKLRMIAELEYEVSEETALENYHTIDPQEMADIDLKNLENYGFDSNVGPRDRVTYRAEVVES